MKHTEKHEFPFFEDTDIVQLDIYTKELADKLDNATSNQDKRIDKQLQNMTLDTPSEAEIVDARGDYDLLGNRLNASELIIKQKIYHFENVEAMKSCLTLKEGDVVQTLGYYEENDGGSSKYKIVNDSSLTADEDRVHDLSNGLKAVMVKENTMIEEITCEERYLEETKTKYWVTYIPHKDKYGNVLKLKLGLADDAMEAKGHLETARSFAKRHNATICMNAGIADNASEEMTGQKFGMRMKDGILISNQASSYWQIHWALGITADNSLVTFGPEQTEEKANELGCVDVTSAMTPILLNGVSQKFLIEYTNTWFNMTETTDTTPDSSKKYYTKNTEAPFWTEHAELTAFESDVTYYEMTDTIYQKQYIGQNTTTKDIYILTTNGKGVYIDQGITNDKAIEIFKELGCDFAYQLDSGGSTALVYRGEMLNQCTDGNGYTERPLADFLYVAYEEPTSFSKDINYINERLGAFRKEYQDLHAYSLKPKIEISSNDDLNNYQDAGTYYCPSREIFKTLQNIPDTTSFISIQSTFVISTFKLIVEKIDENTIMQTLICASGQEYTFTRQRYLSGESYIWGDWHLNMTDITVSYDMTVPDGYTINNAKCYKKHNRVCINCEIRGTFNAKETVELITLPSTMKPSVYVICPGICYSTTNNAYEVCQVQVTNEGKIKAQCNTAADSIKVNIVYDTN